MITSTQTLVIGTRVYCVLHYCGRGIVYDPWRAASRHRATFMGRWRVGWRGVRRCCVMNGHQTRAVPESVARHPVAIPMRW